MSAEAARQLSNSTRQTSSSSRCLILTNSGRQEGHFRSADTVDDPAEVASLYPTCVKGLQHAALIDRPSLHSRADSACCSCAASLRPSFPNRPPSPPPSAVRSMLDLLRVQSELEYADLKRRVSACSASANLTQHRALGQLRQPHSPSDSCL